MKEKIHPQYYPEAQIKCACGAEFTVGATQETVEVETCSQCHPFYTGQERGAFRSGRVQKFQSRLEKKSDFQRKTEKRSIKRRKQVSKKT